MILTLEKNADSNNRSSSDVRNEIIMYGSKLTGLTGDPQRLKIRRGGGPANNLNVIDTLFIVNPYAKQKTSVTPTQSNRLNQTQPGFISHITGWLGSKIPLSSDPNKSAQYWRYLLYAGVASLFLGLLLGAFRSGGSYGYSHPGSMAYNNYRRPY